MTAGEVLDAAHSFPFRPLREMLEDRPFIVIAPHPDDESLACGGLIADGCEQGLRGKVVIVSDGAGSHPNSKAYPPDRLSALRQEEARQAGAKLGLRPEDMLFLSLPDRFVPHQGEEAERAIGVIADCAREIGAGSLSAGDTIPIATTRHPIGSHARFSVASAEQTVRVRCLGHTLPPSTEVDPVRSGFRISIDHEAQEKKRRAIAAHHPQTTALIDDDPGGFLFSQIDLAHFDLPCEFFLESDA